MTKFFMPDGDIITDFRQAKDQAAQIGILADQNCVSKAQMRQKLRELGLLPGEPTPKPEPQPEPQPDPKPEPAPILPAPHKQPPARPPMDELRAMELFREGLDDLQIAEALGETKNRVIEWRYRMHLLRPRGGASEKQKKQRAEGLYGKNPPKEVFQPKKKAAIELLLGKQKKYGRLDTERARELYDQGLGDQRIGDALDVAKSTVASWRKRIGLPNHQQLVEVKQAETEKTESGTTAEEDKAMKKDNMLAGGAAISPEEVSKAEEPAAVGEEAPGSGETLTVRGLCAIAQRLLDFGLGEARVSIGGKPIEDFQRVTVQLGGSVQIDLS